MKTIFEEMGGTYSEMNGYLIPDLITTDTACLGKWGRMRKRYLKEHRPVLYTNLLLSEKLYAHCAETECICEDRLELITRRMAKQEGVTEALKASDQMEWVRRMNSLRSRAEEIVRSMSYTLTGLPNGVSLLVNPTSKSSFLTV